MITFYPGPSKIYPQVAGYLQEAFDSGILSANHRSREFMEMCQKTLALLHEKLNIPEEYAIAFVSSATECWEIIAQSFTEKGGLHLFNGSFGEKWFEYASRIKPESQSIAFELEENPEIPKGIFLPELVCLTQNETSNGTQITAIQLGWLRQQFPESLLAADATSSLGGVALEIEKADLWFASVQKCLGLPAGMGLLIVSPRALEKAVQLNDRKFYNSFLFIHENIRQFQTHYTPNVLGIYLLMRVIEQTENVQIIAEKLKTRVASLYVFFENHPAFKPLIISHELRSDTVICLQSDATSVKTVKEKALSNQIILGNGYGILKNTTLRIANFPQITDAEIDFLKNFFS